MNVWTDHYKRLSNRNIGLLTQEQQEKLRNSKVAICGLGGLGGPIAEMLCRLGIENFRILDNGTFELTNLNRQIYSFTDTDGDLKTNVTEKFLKKINPAVKIKKYHEIDEDNINSFLYNVDAVVLSIDTIKPCLIISRVARELDIPLVEGWALAVGNVRVYKSDSPSLEEVYELPTIGRSIAEISKEEEADLLIYSLRILKKQILGLEDIYPESALRRMTEKNEGTTLGPFVWLTCSLMAIETLKLILEWGKIALAPHFAVYNPIKHVTI